jgi:nitroreductase
MTALDAESGHPSHAAASSVSFPQTPFGQLMGSCRAMRYLRQDPVPMSLICDLVWAATRAPSPGNSQKWHFVIIDDAAVIGRIGHDVAAAMSKRMALHRPVADRSTERSIRDGHHLALDFAKVPVMIVVAAELSYPPEAPEERYVWSTVYPASQNILLAARAMGLGATFTTLHHFAPETFRSQLAVPDHVYIGSVIPIGWPVRAFGPVRRRPLDEVLHRNRWRQRVATAPARD